MIKHVSGHVGGLPVVVDAQYDGEEYQCLDCPRRFTNASLLIAHTSDAHVGKLKGENPQ